jgi:hypothetical protein
VDHNHGLNNGSHQSSHGGGALGMPDMRNHRRNAGACDSSKEGLTGAKFGMKIWTRMGGRCLRYLQTKPMPNSNEEKYVMSNMNEEN